MKKLLNMYFFLFLLILPLSFSASQLRLYNPYGCMGYGSEYADQGCLFSDIAPAYQNMQFNSVYSDTPSLSVRSVVSNKKQSPIIYDMDNDDVYDMIVSSGSTLRIYKGTSLTLNYTMTLNNDIAHYLIQEYNGTTYIVVETYDTTDSRIFVYGWDGSTATLMQNRTNNALMGGTDGTYSNIRCSDYSYCISALYANTGHLTISQFNLTVNDLSGSAMPQLFNDDYGGSAISPPTPPIINTYDIGGDTMFTVTGHGDTSYPLIYNFYINKNTGNYGGFTRFVENTGGNSAETMSNFLTGRFNDNGILSGVMAIKSTTDNIKLRSYSFDGSLWSLYKSHSAGTADVMSNAFLCKIFTNDYDANYCILGYEADGTITLYAVTDFGVGFGESELITSSTDAGFIGWLPTQDSPEIFAHGVNAENNIVSPGVYITDIMSPFGILTTDEPNYFTGNADLTASYRFPNISNSIIIPVNMKSAPYYDVLFLSAANIIYMSDNFVIPNPYIDAYIINPCTPMRLNSTVQISVKPQAYQSNYLVRSRVFFYYNTPYEQLGNWSSFIESGLEAYLTFDFVANQTYTNAVIRMEVEDNQGGSAYLEFPYTVSANGFVFGDCTNSAENLGSPEEEPSVEGDVAELQTNNTVVVMIDAVNEYIGLGRGVVWLIIMVIIGVASLYSLSQMGDLGHLEFMSGLAVIGFVEFLMLVLGVYLGIFGVGLIITISIVGIILIGIFITSKIHTGSGG